jgi:hypothetical protein
MLHFRRFTVVSLLVFALVLAGCESVVTINNRTDPKDFEQITLEPGHGTYYDELAVDVPDDIRKDDYEITDVDIFADVSALDLQVTLVVKLYVALQPGQGNLGDSSINEVIASAELTPESNQVKVEVRHSDLIYDAFDQATFWMKVTIDYDVPSQTAVDVEDIYVEMQMERETGGLFPLFYLF